MTKDDKNASTRDQNNSKVVTRILNSIDPSILLSLQSFSKASEMRSHLQSLNHQINKARNFFLTLSRPNTVRVIKTVQKYYSGFLTLWNEKDSIILATVTTGSKSRVLKIQEQSHIS